jgi:hypothetical protein
MSFKRFGPGSPTGAESSGSDTETGSPGPGASYYPGRESEGYATGGEGGAAPTKGSSVPSRPNPQSGSVDTDSVMRSALDAVAVYGGHNGINPTGSSTTSPAGARTSEDAGSYGSRPPSSTGTNAGDSAPVRLGQPGGSGSGYYGEDAKSEPGTNVD